MKPIALEHQWAVVTGASRGIGASILASLASCGANVIACASRESDEFAHLRASLAHRHGVSVAPLFFDLADQESVKQAGRAIISKDHGIDILVNNGAIASGSLFQMTSIDEMRRVFEVNFFGAMALTQPISRLMARSKSGAIVNIASVAGLRGDPGTVAYGSSKAALIMATKVLAQELAPHGVRVNAVAPGATRTEMLDRMNEKARDRLIGEAALRRAAEPSEIADAVIYLASEMSSFVTGQVLRVDGGQG